MNNCTTANRIPMRMTALIFIGMMGISSAEDGLQGDGMTSVQSSPGPAAAPPHRFADAELRHAAQWRSLSTLDLTHPFAGALALALLITTGWLLTGSHRSRHTPPD